MPIVKVCPTCKGLGNITCPTCKGEGRIEKTIEEAAPYELASEAHESALELWKRSDSKEVQNLVAILYELKKKLKTDC